MAWPAIKKPFTPEQFRVYVSTLPVSRWHPSMIVLHNTAAPTWADWDKTAQQDKADGRVPGTTRIGNLEQYFKDEKHWSGAPHLFIADDLIWVFNPLTTPGVHSPSWNSVSIGIEMIADFDKEDDDSGPGLKVRQNAVFATAVLCAAFGLDPSKPGVIHLHKEDPKTTHDCPGKDFAQDRPDVIKEIVAEVAGLMDGGEHDPRAVANSMDIDTPKPVPAERHATVTVANLNVRKGPGVMNPMIGSCPKGLDVAVLDEARNGTTAWLKIRTPAGYIGWVAGNYVALKT